MIFSFSSIMCLQKSNDFAQEVIQPIEARQPTVEKHDKQKEEEQREAHIDVDKYKRKTQILSGKPPRAQKMMSEEPVCVL